MDITVTSNDNIVTLINKASKEEYITEKQLMKVLKKFKIKKKVDKETKAIMNTMDL